MCTVTLQDDLQARNWPLPANAFDMISLGRAAHFIDNAKASIFAAAFVAVVEDQKEEISTLDTH